MKHIDEVTSVIVKQGMLPLYFNADETVCIKVLRAIYHAGIKVVEFTNRGEAARNNFKKMVEVRNAEMPGMLLGIGTIKSPAQAQEFLTAGADFIISPGFVAEIATFCHHNKILYVPGCMTPTEIIAAENAGIRFIKLFPGSLLGADYLAGIRDIFPGILFMTTGGISASKKSLANWFGAGASAVGIGSTVIGKEIDGDGNYEQMNAEIKRILEDIQLIRGMADAQMKKQTLAM